MVLVIKLLSIHTKLRLIYFHLIIGCFGVNGLLFFAYYNVKLLLQQHQHICNPPKSSCEKVPSVLRFVWTDFLSAVVSWKVVTRQRQCAQVGLCDGGSCKPSQLTLIGPPPQTHLWAVGVSRPQAATQGRVQFHCRPVDSFSHTFVPLWQSSASFCSFSLFNSQLVVLLDPVTVSEMAVQVELMREYFQSVLLFFFLGWCCRIIARVCFDSILVLTVTVWTKSQQSELDWADKSCLNSARCVVVCERNSLHGSLRVEHSQCATFGQMSWILSSLPGLLPQISKNNSGLKLNGDFFGQQ